MLGFRVHLTAIWVARPPLFGDAAQPAPEIFFLAHIDLRPSHTCRVLCLFLLEMSSVFYSFGLEGGGGDRVRQREATVCKHLNPHWERLPAATPQKKPPRPPPPLSRTEEPEAKFRKVSGPRR